MNFTYNLYYFKINVYNSVIECDVFIAVQYIMKTERLYFYQANLFQTDMRMAIAKESDFSEADLSMSNLSQAQFK